MFGVFLVKERGGRGEVLLIVGLWEVRVEGLGMRAEHPPPPKPRILFFRGGREREKW